MSDISLVKTNFWGHVSMDLYLEFEKCIIENTDWEVINGITGKQYHILRYITKIFPPFLLPYTSEKNYLIIGHQREKFFPYFYFKSKKKILWMYDAWEPLFPAIKKNIVGLKINLLLTSSKQAADYFNSLNLPGFSAKWVPEAIDIRNYRWKAFKDKKTDVLQFGRKWDEYHNKILPITDAGINYLYEKEKGKVIFNERNDFIEGLADTKISICVPTNITHPEKTGAISTMTNRYLQSMASKCLILGKTPYDMQVQFDYNPVVEIDMNDPLEQINYLLKNYQDYIPLIEKNYENVRNNHTWQNRITQIKNILKETA